MNVFISNPKLIAWELELIALCCVTRVYIIVLLYICSEVFESVTAECFIEELSLFLCNTEFAREVVLCNIGSF